MKISLTGDGLHILIACDYLPEHNWMAFLSWYSLRQNLPEATVSIASHRRLMQHDFFNWTRRCKIPFILHKPCSLEEQIQYAQKNTTTPLLVISPEMVCVRDFGESGFNADIFSSKDISIFSEIDDLVCDCKSSNSCSFTTYVDGWGKFVTSSWINKIGCPFITGVKYTQGSMTANEVRIGRLWNAATPLFKGIT